MSHRTADPERVRRAHASRIDAETADRVMSREYRTVAPRERGADAREPETTPSPAAVARLAHDLARDAVTPGALALACTDHDAEPGAYCYRGARGVCADRIERSRHA